VSVSQKAARVLPNAESMPTASRTVHTVENDSRELRS